ncbi:MAG: GHKL domain-containing protein [Lysinibacillus sp.]|nr:GHKL domain-containing protein [Lysinibacillus sp.]
MSKLLITFLICITVIVLYLNIFIPTSYSEIQLTKINLVMQVSYLTIISITLILLVKNMEKENKLKNEKMQQDLFSQYMSSLEAINLDMQKFRHDYINILMTMERYIENEDLKGLKTYFHEKITKTEQVTLHKNTLIKDLGNLDIIELKGLLLTKLLLAVEKKLHIQVEIPEKINEIPIDIIDLSRVLGILIDNAIEASINSKEQLLNIAIIKLANQSTLIIVENSFNDVAFDINQLYQEKYSTKNGNRGYGLKNVSDILSKYSNVLLHTSIENHLFIQEIEILK